MEFTISIKPMGGSLSSIIGKMDPPPARHGDEWSRSEDDTLRNELELAFALIATAHSRSREAIMARAKVVIYNLR